MVTQPGAPVLFKENKEDACPICNSALVDRKLKKFCLRCGQLCETCCDGGCSTTPHD